VTEVEKDRSMELQKQMLAEHFRRLEAAPETGEPVVYTFVPGNLTELVRSFGALPVLPEINALQSAMRGKSQAYIAAAEKAGAKVKTIVWTQGRYDLIAFGEFPDEASAMAFNMSLGKLGHLRTETLRAFGIEEMESILKKVQ